MQIQSTCALRLFCIKKLDSMSEEKNKRAAWKKFQNQMKEKRTGKGNTVYKHSFHEVLAVDHSCLMNSVKYFISVLLYQDYIKLYQAISSYIKLYQAISRLSTVG